MAHFVSEKRNAREHVAKVVGHQVQNNRCIHYLDPLLKYIFSAKVYLVKYFYVRTGNCGRKDFYWHARGRKKLIPMLDGGWIYNDVCIRSNWFK